MRRWAKLRDNLALRHLLYIMCRFFTPWVVVGKQSWNMVKKFLYMLFKAVLSVHYICCISSHVWKIIGRCVFVCSRCVKPAGAAGKWGPKSPWPDVGWCVFTPDVHPHSSRLADEAPLASPSGRCQWVCPQSVWRRTGAPGTSDQWSAALGAGEGALQT